MICQLLLGLHVTFMIASNMQASQTFDLFTLYYLKTAELSKILEFYQIKILMQNFSDISVSGSVTK